VRVVRRIREARGRQPDIRAANELARHIPADRVRNTDGRARTCGQLWCRWDRPGRQTRTFPYNEPMGKCGATHDGDSLGASGCGCRRRCGSARHGVQMIEQMAGRPDHGKVPPLSVPEGELGQHENPARREGYYIVSKGRDRSVPPAKDPHPQPSISNVFDPYVDECAVASPRHHYSLASLYFILGDHDRGTSLVAVVISGWGNSSRSRHCPIVLEFIPLKRAHPRYVFLLK